MRNTFERHLKRKSFDKIVFKTSSDTEVFVNAYMYFGDKCFNYFDGMWASAIYDVEKNSLILFTIPWSSDPLIKYVLEVVSTSSESLANW